VRIADSRALKKEAPPVNTTTRSITEEALGKVPALTFGFWIVKMAATTLGDLLGKPTAQGGLHFSRLYASAILLAFIVVCIMVIPQRAARREPAL
jgi:uncharacterized membrane-anchored protein